MSVVERPPCGLWNVDMPSVLTYVPARTRLWDWWLASSAVRVLLARTEVFLQ